MQQRRSRVAAGVAVAAAAAVIVFVAGFIAGQATSGPPANSGQPEPQHHQLELQQRQQRHQQQQQLQQYQQQLQQHQQQLQKYQQQLQEQQQLLRQHQQQHLEQPPAAATATSSLALERVVPDLAQERDDVLPHIAAKVLALERQGKGRKIIAYSLFGSTPKYVQGAVENAMLVDRDWPGWTFRVYVGEGVPAQALDRVRMFGGEVVQVDSKMAQSRGCSTFWRFFAMDDDTATRVIFRDLDSRLTWRDFSAVQEWMNSTRYFHITHDHPNHDTAVMAGAWGTVTGLLHPRMLDRWRANQTCPWGGDQDWLRDSVWPLVRAYGLQHASFNCGRFNASEVRGWPVKRLSDFDMAYSVFDATNHWLGLHARYNCPVKCRRHPDWAMC